LKEQEVIKTQGIHNPLKRTKATLRKRLLTIPEAGEYLGRSTWSIRELIWAGSLPIVRVGRRIHLDIYDLNEWIERNKTRYTY
jgi:excisionase family DNA binding protein